MNATLTQILQDVKNILKGECVYHATASPFAIYKDGWWEGLERAKIENFRFHDWRHTFASRLGMAGIDLPSIQDLMGHNHIEMKERYSHPSPDHKKMAVERPARVPTDFRTAG